MRPAGAGVHAALLQEAAPAAALLAPGIRVPLLLLWDPLAAGRSPTAAAVASSGVDIGAAMQWWIGKGEKAGLVYPREC